MIGAAPWDSAFDDEWRSTAPSEWFTVRDADDHDRIVCSSFDKAMCEDVAAWEKRRKEREARA